MLFVLAWAYVLAYTAPGPGFLVDRLSMQESLMPTLWMILGNHAAYLLLEVKQEVYRHVRSLTLPFLSAASLIAMTLVLGAMLEASNT